MSKKKNKSKTGKRGVARPDKRAPSASRTPLLLGLFLTALAFLLYANTLHHGFALDDSSAITDNWVVKKGTESLDLIFTEHYRYGYWNSKAVLYRPLSLFMFALEWEVSPDNPSIHHWVNVVLYALTAALLFSTLLRIFSAYSLLLPFAVTLLFIVHPVHVEAVANIKSRDEILAFLFAILALRWLWRYFDHRNFLWLLGALVAYGLALLSKESVITFLAIFPLTIYYFHPRVDTFDLPWESLSFLLPAGIYLYLRTNIVGDFGAGAGAGSPLDNVLFAATDTSTRLASAVQFLGRYLWTLLFPVTLCSDYGYNQIPITSWSDWRVLVSLLLHLGLGGYALWRIAKRELLVYGILFYGITLSIFANIVLLIGSAYGERFLYAPSLGFALLLALLLLRGLGGDLRQRDTEQAPAAWAAGHAVPLVALLLVAGLYAARTVLRNPAWKDSYTLYTADLPRSPNSAKLNYHAALETVKRGQKLTDPQERGRRFDRALAGFQRAIEIYPRYADAHGELGLTWFRKGNPQKALESYQKALELNPRKATVYSNMGIIYFQQGDYQRAEEVYRKAVEYDPRYVDARRNLGSVYAMQRRYPEAIAQFEKALEYAPNSAIILYYLGSAYRDSGQAERGQPYLDRAYRLDPKLAPKQ